MIQGKWFSPGSDITQALTVRLAVFGRGEDALDSESWNAVVFEDDLPSAAGRISWKDGAYRLSEICVTEDRRGRRLGDLVLRLLLFKAQAHGAKEVRLVCDPDVSVFFARLGFRNDPSSGNSDEMLLPGDQIDLDTCKSCRKQNCPNRR